MSLLESLSTAPCTPSLTDLSIALSLARQARQLHRRSWQASGQQIALRLENDSGGSEVPLTPDRPGDVLAYLFQAGRAPAQRKRPQSRHASCWPQASQRHVSFRATLVL